MTLFNSSRESNNDFVFHDEKRKISLFLKREDLLHPQVSGNKFRKLKYNIKCASEDGHNKLLTYGGAYSNHIAATARAGQIEDFKTVGIIRGEELGADLNRTFKENQTLRFAKQCGMKLHFISRESYREKSGSIFKKSMIEKFGSFYEIPEGGTNALAVKGCKEILTEQDKKFDFVCAAVGTGGTIAGLIESSYDSQKILGFPALKGDFLNTEINKYTNRDNWNLITDYHFGGYGKVNSELVQFINDFKMKYTIQLDPIYTGKMLFGICDLIERGYFSENTRILAVHTGGLQGIIGINKRLAKKGLPIIKL